jgi:hypothetical protein
MPAHDLETLRTFRTDLHGCFPRRADALFELVDALLAVESVGSLPHLSLQAPYRRGWGSLYDALAVGRIDVAALRGLLRRHAAHEGPPVYAVDLSVWPRCDAEASPERGFYYHPSRHSAGQPIVAGWAYQWLAQLSFTRDSWTAPLDVRRVHPSENAHSVAVAQITTLVAQRPLSAATPLFVFDAGYDSAHLTQALAGIPVDILVRLRADRCFYADSPPAIYRQTAGVPVNMAPSLLARIQRRGQCRPLNTSLRTSSTARCASAPGRGCIPSSKLTQVVAPVNRDPSCAAPSSWSRSVACRLGRTSPSSSGCGGPEPARRTWT